MKCHMCGYDLSGVELFCGKCGAPMKDIVKAMVQEEISDDLVAPAPLSGIARSPSMDEMGNEDEQKDSEYPSGDTEDPNKIEYKRLFKQILDDRKITPDEILQLEDAVKRLGLTRAEEEILQKDIVRELGISYEKINELCVSIVNLHLNINKNYVTNEMDNLNMLVENISDESISNVCIRASFRNLQVCREQKIARIRPSDRKEIHVPFQHTCCGTEVVDLYVEYNDIKGNPYIYRGEIDVRIFDKNRISGPDDMCKSINISIKGERIFGNDLSNLAQIAGRNLSSEIEKEAGAGPRGRSSFLSETDKNWQMVFIFFNEEETTRKRNEILIGKRIRTGENKLSESNELRSEAEQMALRNREAAKGIFERAYNLCKEAKEEFKRVREIDPDHELSYSRIQEIKNTLGILEEKIQKFKNRVEERVIPQAPKITSGCLTLLSDQKKCFLYSKERILLGRAKENDVVLRLIPYHPKEQYMKNWNGSKKISSIHADIINKSGNFYIRDIGNENQGSTNGTYIDGKRMEPCKEYLLRNNMVFSIANELHLECEFFGDLKKISSSGGEITACETVLGDRSDSCFGIDKKGSVHAIRLRRRNNYSSGEEYIILVREITIGTSKGNGIIVIGDKVHDRHARILYRDNQYWIEDLNSRHGTWVNGQEIEPGIEVPLGRISGILLGDTTLKFEALQ